MAGPGMRPAKSWSVQTWFSQANHIFARHEITSNYENYGLVHHIQFRLEISQSADDPPAGYLFLCPVTKFRTGPNSFRWPEHPAYWSMDPCGAQRLSIQEATDAGFPSMKLTTRVCTRFYAAEVYSGLRNFYAAKGFDPESQDVARHLGEPMFYIPGVEVPFAHVSDPEFSGKDEGESEYSGTAYRVHPSIHERLSYPDISINVEALGSSPSPQYHNRLFSRMPRLATSTSSMLALAANPSPRLCFTWPNCSPWATAFQNSMLNGTPILNAMGIPTMQKWDGDEDID
ncbi:hypothetical protein K438DRAFT_231040 [Mycena galopus ATCC 62051]|nr:hypothetical protein K438DRAFT_231040 [Mycena galopus ATCC 62051]